jgi:general secretion pathway protein L
MAERTFAAAASQTVADISRRLGVAGFGTWWADELSDIAPARLRKALERRRLRPVLLVDTERVTFWRPVLDADSYRMQEAGSLAVGTDLNAMANDGRAMLAPLFAPGAHPAVTVALPPRQVLRRTLTLPAAVADNLHATVGYDLDRLTPFKPEEIYFDTAIVARDNARGTISVEVVAARRRVVDHAIALARSFGAEVVAVVPAAPAEAAQSHLDLLPTDEERDGMGWARWQVLVPVVVLVLLALAALLLPIWQKRSDAIELLRVTDAEAIRAQQSDRLREELARATAEYNFTLERKLTHPGVGQVLDEMSRLLPDDTWLNQLEYKTSVRGAAQQREVFIRGESANAGKLVSLLEGAKFVGDASPRSPTTKLQPGPGESFDLGLKVKDMPLPAPVPLTEASVAAATARPALVRPAPAVPASKPAAAETPAAATAPATEAEETPDGAELPADSPAAAAAPTPAASSAPIPGAVHTAPPPGAPPVAAPRPRTPGSGFGPFPPKKPSQ